MALDAFTNFAYSTLTSGITAGATSLTVQTGDAAKFPAAPFNATLYDSTTYGAADLDPNREIVRVTAIASDTFTVTRAQESTSAVAHNTGGKTYSIVAGWTALNANKAFDKTGDTMTGVLKALAGLAVTFAGPKTTTYTILSSDVCVIYDTAGGAFAMTLPAASAGKQLLFIRGVAASGANNMTLTAAGADTIQNGATNAATLAMGNTAGQAFVSDGVSKWYRLV